ncbi:MAG: cytochrome c biogenesis protein CcsA [Acidimicrobiales bacterium]|nr:cytochrome c biogenesis protein CcsA [Acidimicrobiales bacterium]
MTTATNETTPAATGAPRGTGSTTTRVLGLTALVGVGVLVGLGLFWSPPEEVQGDLARIMYVHVPSASLAYLSCFVTAAGSVMYLWKRSEWWDTLAYASAEIGALFMAFACITGSIWARPTWGTFWVWDDARLVTSAMLLLLLLGYLALRKVPGDPDVRAKRSAWLGVLLPINVVLVRQSVEWWRTLHQKATLQPLGGGAKIEDLMLFSLFVGFVVLTLVWVWLLIHRFRLAWLERRVEERELSVAIDERRAEARVSGSGAARFGSAIGPGGGP